MKPKRNETNRNEGLTVRKVGIVRETENVTNSTKMQYLRGMVEEVGTIFLYHENILSLRIKRLPPYRNLQVNNLHKQNII